MAAVSSGGGTQHIRPNNINEDQFEEWRFQCITAMKQKMESNVSARSHRVEEVVNERIDRLHRELQTTHGLATLPTTSGRWRIRAWHHVHNTSNAATPLDAYCAYRTIL